MAQFSLRKFDTQAMLSVVMGLVSLVSLAGLAFVTFQRLNTAEYVIYYGPNRRLAVLAAGAITMGLAACGFGLGLNSAGQKRNEKQQLSWLGFFLSAAVISLALIILFTFQARGEQIVR